MYIPVKERHYVESLQALDDYRVLNSDVFKWLDTLTKDTNVILGEQEGKQFKMHCTHCDNDYYSDTSPKLKQMLECSCCHEVIEYHRIKYSHTAKKEYIRIHILQKINGVIYSRYFCGYKRIIYQENRYKYFLKETKRKRMDSDWTLRYSDSSSKLIPEHPNHPRQGYCYYASDYYEEKGWLYHMGVEDIFKNTKYKYSAIELISGHSVDIKPFEYLMRSLHNPWKERLAKIGFYNLASEYGSNGNHGKLLKLLKGLERNKMKEYKDCDISYSDLEIALACECDTGEQIKIANQKGLKNHYKELRKYISKNKLYDYIKRINSCTEYKDYLDWCKELGENMSDKKILFPQNFKKAHDQKMNQYKLVKDEVVNKQIEDYAKELSSLEFENESLIIRPASSQDELVNESKALNHCVKSYGAIMAKRETSIFVIRKKKTPNDPLVTLELKNGNIVQVRAKNNDVPQKQIQQFVKQWEKRFQLQGY